MWWNCTIITSAYDRIQAMKKSNIAILIVFLICIPLTIFFGSKLPGRNHYVTGLIIFFELLVPFLMAFGRRPQTRETVVIVILCAFAILSRLVPIPHFKPAFAVIMLSGMAFGPEVGFMVGAVSAFLGNFFAGQGAYTPWQMLAYGAGGMLAGFIYQKRLLPRKPVVMAVFGFIMCVVWIGPLLDLSTIILMLDEISWASASSVFRSGLPVNLMQGLCTFIVMLLFGKPVLEKLDRVKLRYGMLEEDYGI